MAKSEAFCMDCLEAMRQMPDNAYDLAVVDPPYGDAGAGGGGTGSENGSTATRHRPMDHLHSSVRARERERERSTTARHRQGRNVRQPDGSWGYANWRQVGGEVRKKIIAWDVAPGKEYFDELFRVSRSQIIWGGITSSCRRTAAF